ncbi:hypothetical protein CRG98_022366 [Punica granatum]|uniref:Retrovirus-related Pol polyprotein from transposon TNT 1-94 n=1 Tax=Punica granatum TaxID=22663 RepID=A0A2I0JLX4_PUNGR|nr:hypothetical protein CRG98_022366 [Punica granatum]
MKTSLVQHGLEGALRGEDKLDPTLMTNQKKLIMAKALSIIQLSLPNKVLREVCDLDSAPDVWKKMELLYLYKSLMNRLYLKQQLYRLRLNRGTSVGDRVDLFNQIVRDLANVDVKIEDDDQVLLLLCYPSKSYENFVDTILYGRTSIILEDVKVSLNLKELQKKLGSLDALDYKYMRPRWSFESLEESSYGDKGLRDGLYVMQVQAYTTTTFERSTLEENYLDDIDLDKVDGCMSLHSISKSLKFLINRVIAFDEAALVEQCKSGSRRQADDP